MNGYHTQQEAQQMRAIIKKLDVQLHALANHPELPTRFKKFIEDEILTKEIEAITKGG